MFRIHTDTDLKYEIEIKLDERKNRSNNMINIQMGGR